jgi:hypothetical protein
MLLFSQQFEVNGAKDVQVNTKMKLQTTAEGGYDGYTKLLSGGIFEGNACEEKRLRMFKVL